MKTKDIAYSAMIMAVIGVFLVVDRMFGSVFIGYAPFVLPIPFAYYTVQHGNRNGFVLYVATSIMAFFVSTLVGVITVSLYGLMGWFYGVLVNRGSNRLSLLGLSFLIDLVIVIITTFALGSLMGYGTVSEQLAYMEEMVSQIFVSVGASAEIGKAYVKPIFYLVTILSAFIEAYVIHTLYLIVAIRMKKPLPAMKRLSDVRWPMWSGYLGLVGLVGSRFISSLNVSLEVKELLLFLSILGNWYLVFHGILFFYRIKGRPGLRRWGFYSIIFLILFSALVSIPLAILGFLAVVSDLVQRLSK